MYFMTPRVSRKAAKTVPITMAAMVAAESDVLVTEVPSTLLGLGPVDGVALVETDVEWVGSDVALLDCVGTTTSVADVEARGVVEALLLPG